MTDQIPSTPNDEGKMEQIEAGRRAAAEVLTEHWSSGVIPVDPIFIARRMGARVLALDLPDSILGAMVKVRGREAEISFNQNTSPRQQRFICGHELGHFRDSLLEFEDRRIDFFKDFLDDSRPKEVYANHFAVALVMPESALQNALDDGKRTVTALMKHFDVAADIVMFRMKSLGWTDQIVTS